MHIQSSLFLVRKKHHVNFRLTPSEGGTKNIFILKNTLCSLCLSLYFCRLTYFYLFLIYSRPFKFIDVSSMPSHVILFNADLSPFMIPKVFFGSITPSPSRAHSWYRFVWFPHCKLIYIILSFALHICSLQLHLGLIRTFTSSSLLDIRFSSSLILRSYSLFSVLFLGSNIVPNIFLKLWSTFFCLPPLMSTSHTQHAPARAHIYSTIDLIRILYCLIFSRSFDSNSGTSETSNLFPTVIQWLIRS